MTRPPDFDELVGAEVPAQERERLRRAHELLMQAGPPPELSPKSSTVSSTSRSSSSVENWSRKAPVETGVVSVHSAGRDSISTERVVTLAGTSLRPQASGTLELGKNDHGNWPMVLRVRGLQELPSGGYYDLYLTKGGRPVVLCGTFNVGRGQTEIRLTAAYDLSHFDSNGWVVTRQMPGHHKPTDVVLQPS